MATPHVFIALTLALVAAACAGPATTVLPTAVAEPTPSAQQTPIAEPTQSAIVSGSTPGTTLQPATETPTSSLAPTHTDSLATPTAGLASWRARADVAPGPNAREDHTWTVSGDGSTAYLFGGRGAAGAVLDDLWQFDLTSDAWTELQPAGGGPAGRFGHTATWVPDVGLVIWSGQGARFFDDIWRYDPEVNAWEELPSLGAVPPARYGSCASLGPDGELWISHGFTEDDGRFADTRSYEFASGTWTDRTPVGDVPVQRCLHDCFWSATDQLILYGGQTTGILAIGDLWSFDPVAGTWTRAPAPETPPRNLYALASGSGGGLVFGGGSVDGGFFDDAWLIPDSDGLVPFDAPGDPPPARSSATLINDVARGRYLLFGGMNADGVLDDVWELGSP